jgi:hypothetical protein
MITESPNHYSKLVLLNVVAKSNLCEKRHGMKAVGGEDKFHTLLTSTTDGTAC